LFWKLLQKFEWRYVGSSAVCSRCHSNISVWFEFQEGTKNLPISISLWNTMSDDRFSWLIVYLSEIWDMDVSTKSDLALSECLFLFDYHNCC
jgi:hypothetical protein